MSLITSELLLTNTSIKWCCCFWGVSIANGMSEIGNHNSTNIICCWNGVPLACKEILQGRHVFMYILFALSERKSNMVDKESGRSCVRNCRQHSKLIGMLLYHRDNIWCGPLQNYHSDHIGKSVRQLTSSLNSFGDLLLHWALFTSEDYFVSLISFFARLFLSGTRLHCKFTLYSFEEISLWLEI